MRSTHVNKMSLFLNQILHSILTNVSSSATFLCRHFLCLIQNQVHKLVKALDT